MAPLLSMLVDILCWSLCYNMYWKIGVCSLCCADYLLSQIYLYDILLTVMVGEYLVWSLCLLHFEVINYHIAFAHSWLRMCTHVLLLYCHFCVVTNQSKCASYLCLPLSYSLTPHKWTDLSFFLVCFCSYCIMIDWCSSAHCITILYSSWLFPSVCLICSVHLMLKQKK